MTKPSLTTSRLKYYKPIKSFSLCWLKKGHTSPTLGRCSSTPRRSGNKPKLSGPPPKLYKEALTTSEKKVELEEEDEEH